MCSRVDFGKYADHGNNCDLVISSVVPLFTCDVIYVILCLYLSSFPTINALTITGVTDRLVGSVRTCFHWNYYLYTKF